MTEKTLHTGWKMRRLGEMEWLPATVPGSVYGDLLANGRMENPFWKDNEDKALELMEYDYEYTMQFDCPEDILDKDRILLHFDGLDTIADVFLNGEHLGDAFNMHRIWEYDIREKVKPAENELRVVLHSPNKYIREAFRECRTLGNDDTLEGFVHIRKAHYMFGWDWGAHLPDAGIFRPVTLLGIDRGRIDNVLILQQHERVPEADSDRAIAALGNRSVSRVTLQLQVTEETAGITDGVPKLMDVTGGRVFGGCGQHMSYQAEITAPDGTKAVYEDSPTEIVIEEPKLWWPNGYGAQDLYTVKVVLYSDGREIDCWEKRIGLRTMNMRREKDEWGECFAHEVNGAAFCHGSGLYSGGQSSGQSDAGDHKEASGKGQVCQLQCDPCMGRRLLSQRLVL